MNNELDYGLFAELYTFVTMEVTAWYGPKRATRKLFPTILRISNLELQMRGTSVTVIAVALPRGRPFYWTCPWKSAWCLANGVEVITVGEESGPMSVASEAP